MKRFVGILAAIILVMVYTMANADPARFLNNDRNSAYHSEHLRLHLGSHNCKVSGDYMKVRKEKGSKKLVGHLEQADTFTLDEVDGEWAKITVTRASKLSKDSRVGMTGWVDADYIECPCSSEEYYNGQARRVYSLGVANNNNVKLREEPSKVSTQFGKLKKGDQVEVLSEYTGKDKATWYRCRYEGKMGYIRSDMIDITETGLPDTSTVAEATEAPMVAKAPMITEAPLEVTEEEVLEEPKVTPAPANWQDVYHQFVFGREYKAIPFGMVDGIETYHDNFGNEYYSDTGSEISFGLYDMNKDGTPELFVDNGFYFDGGMKAVYVYSVNLGRIISVGTIADRTGYGICFFENADYPGVAVTNGKEGYTTTEYYTLNADGRLSSEVVCTLNYNDPNDPEMIVSEPVVVERTSDEALYNVVMNGRSETVMTHSESLLTESEWEVFLSMAEIDRFAYTLRDNDGAEDTLEETAEVSTDPSVSDSLDGYYEHDDSYQYGQLIGDYIPVKVYCDKQIYNAGEPLTFSADILGGTPPFSISWQVEESQTRDGPTPLDDYYTDHEDHTNSTTYATNDRHVEFIYTPPVDSTTLYGMFSVVDSKGVSSLAPDENCVSVLSIFEEKWLYTGEEDYEEDDSSSTSTGTVNPSSGYYDVAFYDPDRPIVYSSNGGAVCPHGWMDVHGNIILQPTYNTVDFERGYYFICEVLRNNSLIDGEYYLVGRDGTVAYTTRNRLEAHWVSEEGKYWYVESVKEGYQYKPTRVFNEQAQDITSEASLNRISSPQEASSVEEESLLAVHDNRDGTFLVYRWPSEERCIVRASRLLDQGYNYLVFETGYEGETFLVNYYFEQIPVGFEDPDNVVITGSENAVEKRVWKQGETEYEQYTSGELYDPDYGWLRTFKDIERKGINLDNCTYYKDIVPNENYYPSGLIRVPIVSLSSEQLAKADLGTIFCKYVCTGSGGYDCVIVVSKPRLPDALNSLIKETHLNYALVSFSQSTSSPSTSAMLYAFGDNEDVTFEGGVHTSKNKVYALDVEPQKPPKWRIVLKTAHNDRHAQSLLTEVPIEIDGYENVMMRAYNGSTSYCSTPFTVSYDYMNLPTEIIFNMERVIPDLHTLN